MLNKNIAVIGASAGGLDVIITIVKNLPSSLDITVFIVWHMASEAEGILPKLLNNQHSLPAKMAADYEEISAAQIYVAPPDKHLLVEDGHIRVTRGPKENRFRPAIDPLFRSAALAYGSRVVGVILSGALDDGVAGLWMIKECGGTTIVQDPADAEVPSMPANAVKAVHVDYCLPAAEIAQVLTRLAGEQADGMALAARSHNQQLQREVYVALQRQPAEKNIIGFGSLSPFTCPECGGVLTELEEGDRLRYRCHTGHAYSAESLLAAINEETEETIWGAIRGIQENVMLLNHLGDHFAGENEPHLAAAYFNKARETQELGARLQHMLTSPGNKE